MKPLDQLTDDEFARLVHESVALRDAPDALVRAAIASWPAPGVLATAGEAAARIVRTVRAVLSFDSWSVAPMSLAMRSMPSGTRHLLFSAEGRDVDLRIRSSPSGFRIAGQILGPDEAGTIELRAEDDAATAAPRHVAVLDELGEFRLDGIVAGQYVPMLRFSDTVVELPPVEIGDRPSS